ncbi:MAG TPA: PhoU domain-containing protein [Vicinamibacterales bacterium]|jgi:hypothetical protein|nr:PhoU domain-containing protein [Vicinamibacterales bacterium]
MGDIAQAMLRDALDAYVKQDSELATKVLNEDDRLDSLKAQVFRDLLAHMLQNQSTVEPSLDLILVSAPSRADWRSCDEHRRTRDLHGVGARRASPSGVKRLTRTARSKTYNFQSSPSP